ncbi:hypothetical protein FA10DRAFT_258729 [Acaromyces ingoldii]|uniref:Uncharacterized protein n=1 Tax=Acaromyces ingoldii TaxID=215250 RepID=A0A316YQN1_9BASI|nr:hypothetical protein FA10DRAFT_258729 [Acaromyces ingoldii]PWN91326.1 hypothetical protein FA10DRAFT_258729 [Acaromyces ingoldii]
MSYESAAIRLRRLRLGDIKVPVLHGEKTPPREFDSSTEETLDLVKWHNNTRKPGVALSAGVANPTAPMSFLTAKSCSSSFTPGLARPDFRMYFEPGSDFTLTLTPSLATLIEVAISLKTFLGSKENDELEIWTLGVPAVVDGVEEDALSPFARPSDLGDETALTEPDEGDKGGADDDDDADKPTMVDFLVAIRAVEAYRERVAAVEVERDEAYARWLLNQAKEKAW